MTNQMSYTPYIRPYIRIGLTLVAIGGALVAPVIHPAHAANLPRVVVRRVTTLDARGRVAHVFYPGNEIQLRIQWTVRGAAPAARQTVTWTVWFGGHEILRRARAATARDGAWSETTSVTVTRAPNSGTHVFWGRVLVDGVAAALPVAFTVRRY